MRLALCHLPTLVETFPDDQIDEDPGQAQAAHQLPLDPAQTFLQSRVGHQHSVTAGQVRSGQVRLGVISYLQYSSTGVFTSVMFRVTASTVELKLRHFYVKIF